MTPVSAGDVAAGSGEGPTESVVSNDQLIEEYLSIMRKYGQSDPSIDQTIVERIISETSALPPLVYDTSTKANFRSDLKVSFIYSAFAMALDKKSANIYSAYIADKIVERILRPEGMYV